jgi:hypothetical protein
VSVVAEENPIKTAKPCNPIAQKRIVLRCMVYANKPGEYTGECIDLNLMVRADDQGKALHSLHEAIIGYLEVAFKGDIEGLVPRPSPFSHRARYHVFALRAALSTGVRRNFLVGDWIPSDYLLSLKS